MKYILLLTLVFSNLVFLLQASSEGASDQAIWNLIHNPKYKDLTHKEFFDKFFNGGFKVKKNKSEDKLEEGHREDKNIDQNAKCSRQFK